MNQKTVSKKISCVGVGLHSGQSVTLTLLPAEANTGIVFKRVDITDKDNIIPAKYDAVSDTQLCTLISNADGVSVGTIEHLMAALAAAKIDNVVVELNGAEVPIMDGSAEHFMFMIDCVGTQEQAAERRYIRITKAVSFKDGDKEATFEPASVTNYSFDIEFASKAIGKQNRGVTLVNGNFREDISRARTFGFAHEVEYLRSVGLARGGSLDNAIVIDNDKILNEGGLRFSDEFVRHKILDAIGDTYLAGMPIIGHYHGVKAGHAINNGLVRALYANPDAFEIVTI